MTIVENRTSGTDEKWTTGIVGNKGLRYHRRGEEKSQDIAAEQAGNEMLYEAITFADLIEAGVVNHPGLEQSRLVSQLLTEARRQIGIVYPADNFEA